jgi:transcriptional regulator GlxA family with amidase domain
VIPGPPPFMARKETDLEFVRKHVAANVTLLTICTGVLVAAEAGVLDGKRATGPRGLLEPLLKKNHTKIIWEDKRWTTDGNVWTSGKLVFWFTD